MTDTRSITIICDKCQHENILSLKYFVGFDYKFENSVIATCQSCNKDFIATFDEAIMRQTTHKHHNLPKLRKTNKSALKSS
jgi:hypothetical protein